MTFENPPPEELHTRKWTIWGVVMIGLFMALIDVTIVNISIPQLERDLDSSIDDVSWVLNSYNIMFAVLLVSMGRLADQFGRRRFFLIGMSIFTVGSLLCALSWSVGALVTFRVVQAVGAAILAPLALAITVLVFPPAQRGLGIALMAMVANAAAALGPPIGGILVEFAGWPWDAGWHWIFMINVPIGIVGIALALRFMPETRDPHAGKEIDWWGMTTIGGAVFCLTFALVEGNDRGWGSPLIVFLFVASALFAGAFAVTQRVGRFPMLTPELVRDRQFAGASLTLLLFAVGMMGALFMTVLTFVNLWGYSELEAALAVTPVPATALLVAPAVGRLANRVAPRTIAIPSLIVTAIALYWLGGLPAEPSFWSVVGPLALLGAGIGATFPAVMIGSMGTIRGQELGLGSGIVNMSRQVGFAIGIALLVAVFTGTIDDNLREARREVVALAVQKAGEGTQGEGVLSELFTTRDPGRISTPARTPLEREAREVLRENVRDSYGAAFRVAALSALLAIPFALTMRRRPAEVAPLPLTGT
jgi:EmrB/QacA subfamily drug resistance transporter